GGAPHDQNHDSNEGRQMLTERCVTMYLGVDYDIFVQNGNDIDQTTNWMTGVFNNVQTLYDHDEITVSLKSIYVWTEQDPYAEALGPLEDVSSADYLFMFNEVRPVFDGDVGQLVGIDPGGLGGVAVT